MKDLTKKELVEINGGDFGDFMAGRHFAEGVRDGLEMAYHNMWDFCRGVWDSI